MVVDRMHVQYYNLLSKQPRVKPNLNEVVTHKLRSGSGPGRRPEGRYVLQLVYGRPALASAPRKALSLCRPTR